MIALLMPKKTVVAVVVVVSKKILTFLQMMSWSSNKYQAQVSCFLFSWCPPTEKETGQMSGEHRYYTWRRFYREYDRREKLNADVMRNYITASNDIFNLLIIEQENMEQIFIFVINT